MSEDRRSAVALPLSALIVLLCLAPPETYGWSAAGAGALVAIAWLAVQLKGGISRPGALLLTLTTLAVCPFVLWSSTPGLAVPPLAMFVLAAALGLLVRHAGDLRSSGEKLVRLFAALAAAVSVYGIYQRLWGLERLAARLIAEPALPDAHELAERAATGRALGTLSTPAAFGGFLGLSIPLTVGLALTGQGRARRLWWGAAAVQVVALLSTASVTATAALLGAVLLATLALKRTRRLALAGAVVLAVLLAGVLALRGATILSTSDENSPLRLRAGNFRSAAAMIADHPWLGVGPGGFAEQYPYYREAGDNETRHVHNLPLEFVAETGLVAGVSLSLLFLWLFGSPLRRFGGAAEPWRQGLAVGLTAFALHNLADYTAFMPSLLWLAALLCGLQRPSAPSAAADERPPVPVGWGAAAIVGVAAVAIGLAGLAEDARVEARAAAFAGERHESEARALRATELAPWDPDAALFLARSTMGGDEIAQASEGRKLLALERAERAVRLAPVRAAARGARARARLTLGDLSGAHADLSQAVRLYPLHEGYRADRDYLALRLVERLDAAGAP